MGTPLLIAVPAPTSTPDRQISFTKHGNIFRWWENDLYE
jgi:hypothetical protein